MLSVYAALALLSTLVLSVLIAVILKMDIRSRSNQVTAIFLTFLLVWSIADLIQRSTDSENTALLCLTVVVSVIIFIPPSILHVAYVLPWKRRSAHPVIIFLYGISFVLLAIHLNTDAFLAGVHVYEPGFGLLPGDYTAILYAYVGICSFAAIFILLARYTNIQGKNLLRQMRLTLIGLTVISILTVFTGALPVITGDISHYPLTTFSFAIGGAVMLYGFARPMPGIPQAESPSSRNDLPSGLKVLPVDRAYTEFHDSVKKGMAGLCISGRDTNMKEETRTEAQMVSARELVKGMGRKEATETLYFAISDAAMDPGNVVLLEGLEEFTGKDGINSLLRDLRRMNLKGYVICAKD